MRSDKPVARARETPRQAARSHPRRARRKQAERTALSDRRMADAAIQLLVQHGIGGATLQAIGERAGYSRGLATHRFGSKAGLLAQVLKSAGADWLRRVQMAVGSRVGAEALCAAVDAQCRFILEAPEEIRAMYLLWFQSIDPGAEFRADVSEVHRAQRRDVVRWIELGQQQGAVDSTVSAERFAEQFSATMAGLVYQWLVNQNLPVRAMHGQLKKDIRLLLAARASKGALRAARRNYRRRGSSGLHATRPQSRGGQGRS